MTEGYSHKAAHIIEHIVLAIALVWAGGCTLIWTQIDMPHSIVNAKSADGTCEVTISELGSPIFFGQAASRSKSLGTPIPVLSVPRTSRKSKRICTTTANH